MASRKEQKDAARQRRLAEEQARASRVQRTRRLQMLGGVVVAAIVIVVVLVVVLGGGSSNKTVDIHNAKATTKVSQTVDTLLKGIPQSGNTIGNPHAKVTLTEYGDLECPICRDFALGAETQLIQNEVRKGTLKITYRSFPTATGDLSDASTIFPLQQTAAYAAGQQNKAWNYITLFYHEQQQEGTPYVNVSFLDKLAKQIPGLDFTKWSTQRSNPKYAAQVLNDEKAARAINIQGTPTLVFVGPKAQTKPVDGAISYSQAQSLIKQVS
jgi:protein-disulfide isomerase